MMFYYLLVAVVDVLTAVNEDDWQIAADIREGNISQFLLKPVDYLWYRLCLFFSGRIAFIAVAALPLAVFIFCFRQYVLPPASLTALLVFPVSLVLTALLQFFISYAMAMLAFWLLEISTFIFILFAFEYLASGHLFPLDILPPALKARALFHAVSLSIVFSHQHLSGQIGGRGHVARAGLPIAVGGRGLCFCALDVAARHQEDIPPSAAEAQVQAATARRDLFHRPARVFGDQRFGIARGFFQRRQGGWRRPCFPGHADIPQQAAPLSSATIGVPANLRFEAGLVELQQFDQIRLAANPRGRAAASNGLRAQIGSTDKPPGNRRSQKSGCRWPGAIPRESRPSIQSSDRRCICAHPVETAR